MVIQQTSLLPLLTQIRQQEAQGDDSFLQDFFGLNRQDFLRASPQTLRSQLNVRQGAPFDPQSGLPLRPARTLEEAANFEFAQNLFVNRLAQANQARAASAIQAQIGLVQRGGPGSLQQLLSPAFSSLANILGTTTFQPFDFTAGVVNPRVGGRRRGGRGRAPTDQFGGISDPFGGRSIQEFGQQPFRFDFQDISDIGQQGLPSGAPPLTLQDQVVQQFDQGPQAQQDFFDPAFTSPIEGQFAEDQGGLFADQGQDFFGDFGGDDFADLFSSSPFAPSEFGLEGIAPQQEAEFDVGVPDESELFGF